MNAEFSKTHRAVDTLMAVFLWLHVPLIAAIAYSAETGWLTLTGLAIAIATAATVMRVSAHGSLSTRLTIAVAFVGMISTLLASLAGSAWQADLHMYYFAALAMMAAYCDRNVILAAASATALHHLTLNVLLPALVFPGGGSLARVLVHAVIVVMETGALVWMIHQVTAAFAASAAALAQSQTYLSQLEEKSAAEIATRAEMDGVRRLALDAAARDVDAELGEAAGGLASAAHGLAEVSRALTGNAEIADAEARAALVAASATSGNVQSVAAAMEELTAAISEITSQVAAGAQRATTATADSRAAAHIVNTLSEEVLRIGDVVALINDVASRTNLLALNATIEAARAGEAGRGFGVVAGEVKNLAAQTAGATTRIQTQIAALQSGTAQAVKAIGSVSDTISAMSATTTAVAAAVEQQNHATSEIARSLQSAADGVERFKQAAAGVAGATSETQDAAGCVNKESAQVKLLTGAISQAAQQLVVKLRAA